MSGLASHFAPKKVVTPGPMLLTLAGWLNGSPYRQACADAA